MYMYKLNGAIFAANVNIVLCRQNVKMNVAYILCWQLYHGRFDVCVYIYNHLYKIRLQILTLIFP